MRKPIEVRCNYTCWAVPSGWECANQADSYNKWGRNKDYVWIYTDTIRDLMLAGF